MCVDHNESNMKHTVTQKDTTNRKHIEDLNYLRVGIGKS